VPWNAMTGVGRVALLGNGKRIPPTAAIAASLILSSEMRREQKRAPLEKPTQ